MTDFKQYEVAVVVLNWNGKEDTLECISALKKQSIKHTIITVDNASSDGLVAIVRAKYPDIILLENLKNLGFAGGVNTAIRYALKGQFNYVALINNDAVPEPTWLEELQKEISSNEKCGIATGKLLKMDGTIDSTGDLYTSWGLAYPRGRGNVDRRQYEAVEEVFGASGGASLYRIEMLREIGLFDEDFFAYYEDVDLSFRAQLAGWRVVYVPSAIAHHKIGASSSKVKGFTTYQYTKNMPWLFWKNVPTKLLPTILPRFTIAYTSVIMSSLTNGKIRAVLKGLFMTAALIPKKLVQRTHIQKTRKVSDKYITSIITYDLPPNAFKLIRFRTFLKIIRFWK